LAVAPTNIVAAGTNETDDPFVAEVARYSPDGVLDGSFGQSGVATPAIPYDEAQFEAVIAEPDGTIVLLAHAINDNDPQDLQHALLLRLTSSGNLDPSFQGGLAELPIHGAAVALAVYDAERVVCAIDPVTQMGSTSGIVVVRIAVGTALRRETWAAPRTDPSVQSYRTRLLLRVRSSKRSQG
jgi:hypothetical protein